MDDYRCKYRYIDENAGKATGSLENREYDDYGRLLQLCDSTADGSGIVDKEPKAYFQDKIGCDLYILPHNQFQRSA